MAAAIPQPQLVNSNTRPSQQKTSRTFMADSNEKPKYSASAVRYLNHMLPNGWQTFFRFRKCGKGYGTEIKCPHCGVKPPEDLAYGYQRWRWMTLHTAIPHGRRYAGVNGLSQREGKHGAALQ